MRTSNIGRVTGCLAALWATLGGARTAHAQADTDPPLPNVMLLIDTSGSMEFMMDIDPVTKQPRLPTCNTGSPELPNEQNRWTTLTTVLTGEYPQFSCWKEQRSDPSFKAEYTIGTTPPYDADYYLPHHRIVSRQNTGSGNEECVVGPDASQWLGSPYAFNDGSIITRPYNGPLTSRCKAINSTTGRLLQTDDGLLDVFREKARFGLMTFDSMPDHRTGLGTGNTIDAAGGVAGLWSYFPNWSTIGTAYAKGMPELCTTPQEFEVGARNAAAPPWEGRMISFGTPAMDTASLISRNDQIQRVIGAVRPFGATPTAGMMADADYFFTSETAPDPTYTTSPPDFGPYKDPYVVGGCRKQYIILLTDGLPSPDLRDGCTTNADPGLTKQQPGVPGTCPFLKPSDTAYRLANLSDPNHRVQTFVVGFAFSSADNGAPVKLDCSTLTGNGDAACANLATATDSVKACCEMAKIAYNGGTTRPRFADNKQELRKALNDILSQVVAKTTSRTVPVFASAGSAGGGYAGGADKVAGYNILSSFKVSTGGLWRGVLERQRYLCKKDGGVYTVSPEDIDPSKGDSFSTNLTAAGGLTRQFFSIIPTDAPTQAHTTWTIRKTSSSDGLGTSVSAAPVYGQISSFYTASDLTASMALGDPSVKQSVCGTLASPVSVQDCRNRILRWYTGLPPIDGSIYSRVDSPLGSIYHATPTVVGPPGEFLRDDSYTQFATKFATRAPVLYASTTDGQLHAFKLGAANATDTVQVDSAAKNELWSFIPPAILPKLQKIYPGVETRLLDVPVVERDVVFSRDRNLAIAGAGADAWHSTIVTGFGPSLPGFFALDVTDPTYDSSKATTTGPQFLWQLANDSKGNPLFASSATPAITTVFLQDESMPTAREVAVAILPGGSSAAPTLQPGNGCARKQSPLVATVDSKWKFRSNIRCYNDNDVGRSLTVVRLDTGEVLRRFHRCDASNQPPLAYDSALLSRSTCTPFDSPITGVPLPYPNATGQVSSRAFVGDQDGAMWRLDMSSLKPSEWKVAPFFDSYAFSTSPTIGQPILSQPVAALDAVGNLVVAFSTGEQDRFDGVIGMQNVLWSITEKLNVTANTTGTIGAQANWHLGTGTKEAITANPAGQANSNWTDGIRVAGPLSLFDGKVFFSTYKPPAPGVNACDPGSSVLWGVDYLRNTASDPTGDAGPLAALTVGGATIHAKVYSTSLIFGVGIQRLPSCYDTSTVSDPYIGFGGGSTMVSDLTKPEYFLAVQTGVNGTTKNNAETKFDTIQLQPPASGARFSSWSSVIE